MVAGIGLVHAVLQLIPGVQRTGAVRPPGAQGPGDTKNIVQPTKTSLTENHVNCVDCCT